MSAKTSITLVEKMNEVHVIKVDRHKVVGKINSKIGISNSLLKMSWVSNNFCTMGSLYFEYCSKNWARLLTQYEDEEHTFLKCILTCDETCTPLHPWKEVVRYGMMLAKWNHLSKGKNEIVWRQGSCQCFLGLQRSCLYRCSSQ